MTDAVIMFGGVAFLIVASIAFARFAEWTRKETYRTAYFQALKKWGLLK